METNKKSKLIKIIVGIVIIALIIGIVFFAINQVKKADKERKVEEAKIQLNEALSDLYSSKPNSNSNDSHNSGITNTTPTENEVQEYIDKYFILENAVVEEFESYSGKKWGLTKIQVKNKGNKTVEEFEITVYFQDEEGKDIAEDSFYINDIYINNPIKPNYSWKQEDDRYYTFDNLTSEVNPAKHRIEITDLKFE